MRYRLKYSLATNKKDKKIFVMMFGPKMEPPDPVYEWESPFSDPRKGSQGPQNEPQNIVFF